MEHISEMNKKKSHFMTHRVEILTKHLPGGGGGMTTPGGGGSPKFMTAGPVFRGRLK